MDGTITKMSSENAHHKPFDDLNSMLKLSPLRRALGTPNLWPAVLRRALGTPNLWPAVLRRALGTPNLWPAVLRRALGTPNLWHAVLQLTRYYLWSQGEECSPWAIFLLIKKKKEPKGGHVSRGGGGGGGGDTNALCWLAVIEGRGLR